MIETDSKVHACFLISQMETALKEQCRKLDERLKIKLQFDKMPQFEKNKAFVEKERKEKELQIQSIEEGNRSLEGQWSILGGEVPL